MSAETTLNISPALRERAQAVLTALKAAGMSIVTAGQKVGIKQVDDILWLARFMIYDLGYFDEHSCRLEPIDDPFGKNVLPMSQE